VDKIVAARRHTTMRLDDVARLTSGLKRAKPFLVAADYHPKAKLDRLDLRERLIEKPQQLSLFG
jgi:predicted DNA-binding helix-hairpin-helix protein